MECLVCLTEKPSIFRLANFPSMAFGEIQVRNDGAFNAYLIYLLNVRPESIPVYHYVKPKGGFQYGAVIETQEPN